MKLDLSKLKAHAQIIAGQVGQRGQPVMARFSVSPRLAESDGTKRDTPITGDQHTALIPVAEVIRPTLSHACPQVITSGKPNDCRASPPSHIVPHNFAETKAEEFCGPTTMRLSENIRVIALAWLAHIEEIDTNEINRVLWLCSTSPKALDHVLRHAKEEGLPDVGTRYS